MHVYLAMDHAASFVWLTPQLLLLLCIGTLGAGGVITVGPVVIQGPKRPRRRRNRRKRK